MKALGVLARLPVTARVKPRLAATITTALATKFYRACAENTIVESARCEGVVRYLFFSDGSRQQAEEWMTSIRQEGLQLQPQTTWTDEGRQFCDAFQTVFATGAAMVVLITSDVPDMEASIISNAFGALEMSDVVFGPTHDGGYYLIGLRSHQPSLFEGIPWGTDKVLQMSLDRAESLGLAVAPLASDPLLYDIDTLDSLVHWMKLPSSKTNPHYGLSLRILDEHDSLVEALSETGYTLATP
ncbi:unnamed protein product [Calypogeia fissa]